MTERLPDALADAISLDASQSLRGEVIECPVHVDLSVFGSTSMVDAWLERDPREPGRLSGWLSPAGPWTGGYAPARKKER